MRSILIAMLLLFSAAANSAAVEWTFQNVVFDDGATLSGSFVMQEGGTRTDVNLSMTGGSLSDTNYSYFFNYPSLFSSVSYRPFISFSYSFCVLAI